MFFDFPAKFSSHYWPLSEHFEQANTPSTEHWETGGELGHLDVSHVLHTVQISNVENFLKEDGKFDVRLSNFCLTLH